MAFLSDPAVVLRFDFEAEQLPERGEERTSVRAAAGGRVAAVLVSWRARCARGAAAEEDGGDGGGGGGSIGTAQECAWQDHWHSTLHALPHLDVSKGEALTLVATHNDFEVAVRCERRNGGGVGAGPGGAEADAGTGGVKRRRREAGPRRHLLDGAVAFAGRPERLLQVSDGVTDDVTL